MTCLPSKRASTRPLLGGKRQSHLLRRWILYLPCAAEKKAYPVALICSVIQIYRSGYYAWRKCENHQYSGKIIASFPLSKQLIKNTRGPMVPDGLRNKS